MADNASERMRSVSYGKANNLVGHPPWVHVIVPSTVIPRRWRLQTILGLADRFVMCRVFYGLVRFK
jgi:hypothetical protein